MTETASSSRIAIIGRAGRFPAASSVAEFWRLLAEGRSAARRLSEAELIAAGVSRRALADPAYVRVANILPDMECFDAGFFGFSPREAAILDPQHRHFLECGWEALEDAGHMPETFDGRIGVFAGSGMQAYLPFNLLSNPQLVEEIGLFLLRHTGNDKDFLTTRLSYLLNLTGPSVAVQTACSTSLVAVHLAMSSLLNMECDMAIAGGVTIELPHGQGYRYAEGEILSPDGLCRAFDDDSKGTVFGSGAALVVLRRYEDALADGDDIKAVILASAVNNDGSGKASYLAPSVDGQAEAAAEALALSGLAPGEVSYIETHGTGTPIGDPIELSALNQVYGAAPAGSIGVGSVKTNIGHLDTAAGTASLIKVVEALRHRRLPASLNFRRPNSRFDFASSPFRVVAEGRDWSSAGPRRAAVNSLGVGGTNAHLILEEAPARPAAAARPGWRLFPFSARTPAAAERLRDRFATGLDPALDPADVAFTLRNGRRAFPERFAVVARDLDGLREALAAKASPFRRHGRAAETPPRILFVYPGGGAQYPGAGAGLLAASPVFADAVAECFALLPPEAPPDLHATMFGADLSDAAARLRMGRSAYAIPALFILEYAYTRLWESWGIRPDAILAHSVGEYAGAVASGALGLAEALRIVTLRGRVMDEAPSGAMTTVPAPAETVRGLIGADLDIAAINSSQATVVSGTSAAIEALESRLAGTPQEARRIHIEVAAHSRLLDGQLDRFRAGLEGIRFGRGTVPMVSSTRGGWGRDDDFVSADYWVRHLRQTVRFTEAIAAALDRPDTVVIEVGPGQTTGPLVSAAEVAHPARAVLASAPRPRDGDDEMGVALAALGGLWAQGVALDPERLPGAGEGRRVSLPTYPFEKERHWIEPGQGRADAEPEEPPPVARIADPSGWTEVLDWQEAPRSGAVPSRAGSWLVLAAEDALSRAVLEDLRAAGAAVTVLRAGAAFAATADGFALRPDCPDDWDALAAALPEAPGRVLSLWGADPDRDGAAFAGAYLLARWLQAADPGPGARLTLVVAGSAPLAGEPAVAPELAALLGVVRVAPREIAGLTATLVDVARGAGPDLAAALLAEAAGADAEDHVALRGPRRYARRRHAVPAPRPSGLPSRLRQGGAYLVTGGTGGIGRLIALWLAQAAARIVLVSRRAAEDAALRRAIEAAGGEVRFASVDVTDAAALAAAVAEAEAAFGPLNGVIHAAGVLDDAPLAAQPLDRALAVMAPKVTGALTLDRLLPPGRLDFFAVISSSSVVLGGAGQTAYVAANAALEAIAEARPDGLSIAWGTWRDTGMAARAYGAGETVQGGDPLIGRRSDRPGGGAHFSLTIDPETDWRVAEHVVGGRPVLPGTAYIELAEAAARAVLAGRPFELAEISFERPMTFEALPRPVGIRVEPDGPDFAVTIESSARPGDEPVEHMRLRLRPVAAPDPALPSSLAAMPAPAPVAPEAHRYRPAGIDFGPRWPRPSTLALGEGRASGRFVLAPQFHGDLSVHGLHPALLDMAATVGIAAQPPAEGRVSVPLSVARLRVFAPLPAAVEARAVRVAGEPGRFAEFDVALFDDAGRPLAVLEGFALREVEAGALAGGVAPTGLLATLLATGIRASEAPDLFARVFDHAGRSLVVSPVPLDLVRLRMAEVATAARRRPDRTDAPPIADPLTAAVAAVWSEILGVSGIGPEDDFFALGGHSLNAVRMFARLRKDHGVTLPLAALFERPRLADLVALLRERLPAAPAGATEAPAAVPAVPALAVPALAVPAPAVAAAPREDRRIGMTEGQREIAAAILVEPAASLAYNLSFSLHLDGTLDPAALRRALEGLVQRHEGLRATFDLAGSAVTLRAQVPVTLEELDLSEVADGDRPARRDAFHADRAAAPFDLARGPVFRAALLRLGPNRWELMLFVHHIACDGWSMGVLIRDLAALYSAALDGRVPDLPPAPGLGDLVEAEARWAEGPDAARHREFWLAAYAGPLPAMDLPTDRPHPPTRATAAARIETRLDPDLEAALRARAQAAGTSPRELIFAAFRYYLSRMIGSDDVVVALPAAGQVLHGLDSAVAHGINLLPIRGRIDPETTLGELLSGARRDLLGAVDHQGYTYGRLMRDRHIKRDPSRLALVPVVVNFDYLANLGDPGLAGLTTRITVNPTGHEHFEIFFNIFDAPGRIELAWNYATALFDRDTIDQHARNFRAFLAAIGRSAPDPATPVAALLATDGAVPASGSFADPGAAGPQTITEVFAAVAAAMPGRIALRHGSAAMDYATLDALSDALAARLADEGVRPGDLVGITSQRSLSLIVAVLAVLKAGAGYVPFDLTLPVERLRFMAGDTGVRVLLGRSEALADVVPRQIAQDAFPPAGAVGPGAAVAGESIAYVMFTSGTTGVPKGVVLPHRSVIRMLRDTDWLRLGPDTVTLHSSAFAFDTSIIDIFGALLHGGTVVIPPDGTLSIAQLSDAIESHGVNTLWLTTGLFQAVADLRPGAFARVDQVIVGGDVVSPVHVERVLAVCPGLTVINGYGPTESNVTTAHRVSPADLGTGQPLPIGRAVPGTQVFIVDGALRPVPPGIMGELAIAGRGLALGYWNRADLTDQKFVPAPWNPDLRIYRSGDLASARKDGRLRFFGRADTQVKVRGFRVELTEIEAALEGHPGVRQAVVVAAVPEGQADKVLVAYVVAEGAAPDPSDLAEHLAARLPDFARPAFYVPMPALPLNANGKVDRRALPAVTPADLAARAAADGPPEGPTESRLAAIWSDVLGVPEIGAGANFFELGGHSLLAVRLFDRIRRDFGQDLPLSTLFRHQTLRELAALLDRRSIDAPTEDDPDGPWDTSTVIDPGPGSGARPLFIVGGVGGNVNNLFELGALIGRSRPMIGFQTRGVQGHTPRASIEEMAAENVAYMRQHQPEGPYLLAGYSGGALTALEMVRQIEAAGERVERLFVLDTFAPGFGRDFRPTVRLPLGQRLRHEVALLRDEGIGYLGERIGARLRHTFLRGPVLRLVQRASVTMYRVRATREAWLAAARTYSGGPVAAPVTLFRTRSRRLAHKLALEQDPALGWGRMTAPGQLETPWAPGDHLTMLKGDNARTLAGMIEARLEG